MDSDVFAPSYYDMYPTPSYSFHLTQCSTYLWLTIPILDSNWMLMYYTCPFIPGENNFFRCDGEGEIDISLSKNHLNFPIHFHRTYAPANAPPKFTHKIAYGWEESRLPLYDSQKFNGIPSIVYVASIYFKIENKKKESVSGKT